MIRPTSRALGATALLALLAGPAPAQDEGRPRREEALPRHHLVEIAIRDAATLDALFALDLDMVRCQALQLPVQQVDVVATDGDVARLREAGLSFEIAIEDLEQHYAERLAAEGPFPDVPNPPIGQGAMGGHYTLDQAVSILDGFAQAHPSICAAKVSIGQSIEGRDLWMVKISDNVGVDENEPEILFDALHHAREPASMETTLLFMEQLLEGYGTDPVATYTIDNRELYFVPVVNPDGYEYNRQTNPGGGGLWRKNRRGGFGIDLNRNYASFFASPGGSSSSPSSSSYHGTGPFSEPETAALEAFAASREFVHVVSSHSYSDVLLRPWGYQTSHPANRRDYDRFGKIATEQTGIAHGPFSTLLGYLGSGTACDHHHVARGSFSWTPELGRNNEGFWPTSSQLVSIANRHQDMYAKLALLTGVPPQDGEIVVMSTGQLGSEAAIGMLGARGGRGVLLASSGTGNTTVPGIAGPLLLDPADLVALPQVTFPASGYQELRLPIPNVPALSGTTVWFQLLFQGEVQLLFGNLDALTL